MGWMRFHRPRNSANTATWGGFSEFVSAFRMQQQNQHISLHAISHLNGNVCNFIRDTKYRLFLCFYGFRIWLSLGNWRGSFTPSWLPAIGEEDAWVDHINTDVRFRIPHGSGLSLQELELLRCSHSLLHDHDQLYGGSPTADLKIIQLNHHALKCCHFSAIRNHEVCWRPSESVSVTKLSSLSRSHTITCRVCTTHAYARFRNKSWLPHGDCTFRLLETLEGM